MEVIGIRCERVACCAETRRSHSRARTVARCGFEAGISIGVLVVGLRTMRLSRFTVRVPSARGTFQHVSL